MDVALAQAIWTGIGIYFGVGLAVALALTAGLVGRIDPLAAAAPMRVRLVLVPGMSVLWPVMLVMALRGGKS